jgi:hypothetical protein
MTVTGLPSTGATVGIGAVLLGVGVVVGGVPKAELLLVVVMPLPAGRAVHCATCMHDQLQHRQKVKPDYDQL